MTEAQIAAEIQRRGLEVVYLGELAASLGYTTDEGWSEAVFKAIETATPRQRRDAALRTLQLADEEA